MPPPSEAVAWHDAECGGYSDDLALWDELAERADGPILDLGCGAGRVALRLAEGGHEVWALDVDHALVVELRARAAARGLEIRAMVGDVRVLDLDREFPLVIAAMQLVQLLGEAPGRRVLLERVREHLEPGGVFAAAIVEGVPPGALEGGEAALPDVVEADGSVYSSLPLGAAVADDVLEVRRLRQVVSPQGKLREHVHGDRLHVLHAGGLEAEALACDLLPLGRREIPAGDTHVGSTVVLLQRGA